MQRRTTLFLVLAMVLAVVPTAVAGATPGTTTVFEIGDHEPGSSPAVGASEFSQTGWAGLGTYPCNGCDVGDFPAGVIDPARVDDGSIHDARGVAEVTIAFELTADFIDLELTLSKFGEEDDSVTVDAGDYVVVTTGGIEGVWTESILAIPSLDAGSHEIAIVLDDPSQGNGAHLWDYLALTGDQVPAGAITDPGDGDIVLVGDPLVLGATYSDDDPGAVDWAVRSGTCAAGINTVAGNVDGFSDAFAWDGAVFSAVIDTTGWGVGDYCFVFNPREDGNEPNLRLTREFRIADGMINGGGQLLQGPGKDALKISFGGELYRFGTTLECEWQVNFHNVGVTALDKAKFHASSCTALNVFAPQFPADGIVNFEAHGSLGGELGYTVLFRMEDAGEPGFSDTMRIELFDGATKIYDTHWPGEFLDESNNVGTARTGLDNGNLQIDMR